MKLKRALEILKDNEIFWTNYFDLVGIETKDIKLLQAIERVKTYISIGR